MFGVASGPTTIFNIGRPAGIGSAETTTNAAMASTDPQLLRNQDDDAGGRATTFVRIKLGVGISYLQ